MQRLRNYSIELILVLSLVMAVGFFGYLGYGLVSPAVGSEDYSSSRVLEYVDVQMAFGTRVVGTQPSVETGEWLVMQLRNMGWNVYIQPFIVPVPSTTSVIPSSRRDENGNVTARNIIAVRQSLQAGASVGLLVSHYDTRAFADADPDRARRLLPAPGANGGAAATALLLEIARTLNLPETGPTICLVFLDAEDNRGIEGWVEPFGNDYFLRGVEENIPECADPRFAVALDFVGGLNQRLLMADKDDEQLRNAIWDVAAGLGFEEWFVREVRASSAGFQTALQRAGIPTVAIIDVDYPFRYTTADVADKLSEESILRVGQTLKTWLEAGAPTN